MIFATVVGVTLRALLGRRRTILMLLLAGVPVLLGLLVRANGSGVRDVGATLDGLVVRVVLPLVALVFGTAALGSELEDGTAVPLLTKPIRRSTIVLAKIGVAGTLTATLLVPSTVIAGLDDEGLGLRPDDRRARRVVRICGDLRGAECRNESWADHRAGVRAHLGGRSGRPATGQPGLQRS